MPMTKLLVSVVVLALFTVASLAMAQPKRKVKRVRKQTIFVEGDD